MPRRRLLPILLCMLSLTACNGYFGGTDDDGGDGGGGNGDAQGIWDGTRTGASPLTLDMLTTPANDLWAISWNTTSAVELLRGNGSLNGQVFTGKGQTFSSDASQPSGGSGPLDGTLISGRSFDGTLGTNVTFSTDFVDTYNQAFDQTAYAGTWEGRDSFGARVTITVTGRQFKALSTVPSQPGQCTTSGELAPSPTGKNFATANFNIGVTNCPSDQSGTGMQGVAFIVDKDGTPTLLIAGTDTGPSKAWFAFAQQATAAPATP